MGDRSLRGRVALVTGASSGIGRAIALALGSAGAGVILVGRNWRRLDEAAAQARELGASDAAAFAVDLTEDNDLRALAARVLADFSALDILVHSAGAYDRGPIATAPVEDLDRQYMVNVRGPFLLTQLLLTHLAEKGAADVVFINSSQGLAAQPNTGAFAATQHGLRALADSLRAEMSERGIRVLSVHLGRTATPRQAQVFAAEGRPYAPEKLMQPEDVAKMVVTALCLPRRAELVSMSMRAALKF